MRREKADATPGGTVSPSRWRREPTLRLLPASATSDARWLVLTRALRALADGAVSMLLVSYLHGMGFSAMAVGAIVTGTLLGSAALTLRWDWSRTDCIRCGCSGGGGVDVRDRGRLCVTAFWPLFIIAVVRHAQSLRGRREPLSANRAGGAGRDRRGQRPDRHSPVTTSAATDRCVGRVASATSRDHRAHAVERGRRRTARIHRLRAIAIPVLVAYFRMSPAAEADLIAASRRRWHNRARS